MKSRLIYNSKFIFIRVILIGVTFFGTIAQLSDVTKAQNTSEYSYLFPIQQGKDSYEGEGVDWFINKGITSQYVLFGEQHRVKELGRFIAFTLGVLQPEGFDNLGLEIDSWSANTIQEKGLEYYISTYPNSLAFGYDGELELLQYALDNDIEITGLDQMVTAIHPFQRLIHLSTTSNQRRLSRGAFLKSVLKMGEYSREEHFADIAILKEVFQENDSHEVELILNELEISMDIYTKWRAGRRGEISRRLSPEIRENLMKDKFTKWMANQGDIPTGKAVFKMGGAHLMYGVGPNGVETLGQYIREYTNKLGMETLSIAIRNFNPESSVILEDDFGESNIVLIDTKQMLHKHAGNVDQIVNFDANKSSLKGYDAIIYFKNQEWSSQNILNGFRNDFQSSSIIKIAILAILLLFIIISLVPFTIQCFKQINLKLRIRLAISILLNLVIVFIISLQVGLILNSNPETARIMDPITSNSLFTILFLLVTVYLYQAFQNFQLPSVTQKFKIYYLTVSMIFGLITLICFQWNIGGMLSLN
ncbi:MAG: hypothetical protein BalsKO_06650 [Balneolaceae bacterium]